MKLEFAAFAFIFTLAAVINGLGIVRWLTGFAEVVRRRHKLQITTYWTFSLFAAFQFLLHILLWWSLWGIRSVEAFNFLDYLYLLTGPVLFFLASSLLIPDVDDNAVDLRGHFEDVRQPYATVLLLMWLWVLFLWPLLRGLFPPTAPIIAGFIVLTLALRFSANERVHAATSVLVWLVLVAYIAQFAMQLGGVGATL